MSNSYYELVCTWLYFEVDVSWLNSEQLTVMCPVASGRAWDGDGGTVTFLVEFWPAPSLLITK